MTATFPVSQGLLKHRKRMGSAIWEYLWLVSTVTQDEPDGQGDFDGVVLRGEPIPARRIANDLDESTFTARANLRRLEREGYIRRSRTIGEGHVYVVTKSKKWLPKRNGARAEKLMPPVTENCTSPDSFRFGVVQRVAKPGTEICTPNKEGIEHIHIDTHRSSSSADDAMGADARHAALRDFIGQQWLRANRDKPAAPWNGRSGMVLKRLLGDNPRWTLFQLRQCVIHRFASDCNQSEEPAQWLPRLLSYAAGPLDRFNKPKAIEADTGKFYEIAEREKSILRDRHARTANGGKVDELL